MTDFKIPTTNAELQVRDVLELKGVNDTCEVVHCNPIRVSVKSKLSNVVWYLYASDVTRFTFVSRPGIWPVIDDDGGMTRCAGHCGHDYGVAKDCVWCAEPAAICRLHPDPNTETIPITAVVGSLKWAKAQNLAGGCCHSQRV